MKHSPYRHIDSIFLKKKPIQLTLFITRKCNAACNFCFYLSAENRQCEEELSLAELEKISSHFNKLLWLAFSGGEIFLRRDLPEIVNIFYHNNSPAIILLPTNGLLPEKIYSVTREIVKSCPKSTVVVKVSVDGRPEVHDSIRGVQGAHQKAVETYHRLEELLEHHDNFELGINTVFCADTQDGMLEHIHAVGDLTTCKTHTVSLIRGTVDDERQKKCSLEKYRQTITVMEKELKQNATARYRFKGSRLKTAQDILQRRCIYWTALHKKQALPCYAGRLTMVITENGDIFPCESFDNRIGNLRESDFDFEQIFTGRRYKDILRSIRRRECYCHHECYMMMNILFNPAKYPALLRQYLAL